MRSPLSLKPEGGTAGGLAAQRSPAHRSPPPGPLLTVGQALSPQRRTELARLPPPLVSTVPASTVTASKPRNRTADAYDDNFEDDFDDAEDDAHLDDYLADKSPARQPPKLHNPAR